MFGTFITRIKFIEVAIGQRDVYPGNAFDKVLFSAVAIVVQGR